MRALFLVLMIGCGGSPESTPKASASEAPSLVQQECSSSIPDVVAMVGGDPVTRADLEEVGKSKLIEAESALSTARHQILSEVIFERMMKLESAERNLEVPELLKVEVDEKTTTPTDEEVSTFFTENSQRMEGDLQQMTPAIMQYLMQERQMARFQDFLTEMKTKYKVEKSLPHFKVDVDGGEGYRLGPKDAPIQIIEFSDFQCPYCSDAAETVKELVERYDGKVAVTYRHFPLPNHASAPRAAEASECAGAQGKFFEYHDLLFSNQKAWSDEDYTGYANQLKLNETEFLACMAGGEKRLRIQEDMQAGQSVGMGGTPGFYINGIPLAGAQPMGNFVEIIDGLLGEQ